MGNTSRKKSLLPDQLSTDVSKDGRAKDVANHSETLFYHGLLLLEKQDVLDLPGASVLFITTNFAQRWAACPLKVKLGSTKLT